jgi:hypothetical protein
MLFLRWTIWLRGAVAITDSAERKRGVVYSIMSRLRSHWSGHPSNVSTATDDSDP